jgi:hypothetical protein
VKDVKEKKIKIEIIKRTFGRPAKVVNVVEGTLTEMLEQFSYTLDIGASYDKKVNRNPKSGVSLVDALNKAAKARAVNINPSTYYSLVK